ncbi:putative N-acylethanolamine amidohydrolase [Talaromyces proteolyticus]|uniref:N-acylethanolamine amidohydrolase n=1 Tax=Talaromyces proteolyticus TaxID=1131652 RepID=A0AAD4KYG2_9EURO|nr:putative N-acylethanolamine amidohydrolase [Talaromyces proteolyticus]KAH8698841.1 putative N-acylethanolamine amidohydrolase [Talaromyces proteolyticus]
MTTRFHNYPEPRKGPDAPYKHEDVSVPVLRGPSLAIGASLIHSWEFLQNILWRNAGLLGYRKLTALDQYLPRFDPAVVPNSSSNDSNENVLSSESLPAPSQRRGDSSFWTSADYHQRYLAGELTPTVVVETLLPLIQRDGKQRGKYSIGFVESNVEIIRAAAAASTKRYRAGTPLGPLDGVPVAVKDEVHLKGYKRTLGSKLDFKHGIEATSWCVEKWEEAGAIIIGKTTMHEIGIDTTNNNPNTGTPRNPHNSNYYCGGSSGGSGYALAAGLIPIALGADGGGSIRIPSSFCGVYGLKPTHGRVSAAPTPSLAPSVGVYGPMAASIDDLALAYRLMAAPPPASLDALASGFPSPLTTLFAPSAGKTIGIVRPWLDRAEPAVRAIFDKTLASLQSQYTTIDIDIPYLPEGQHAHALTILGELASGVHPSDVRKLLPHTKLLIAVSGNKSTTTDYIAAQRLRSLLMSHLAHLFTTYPDLVILTPTTPLPGWKIAGGEADLAYGVSDARTSTRNMEYVWLANFTGCPAISVPAGYVAETKMPVGVMAMGEWGSEEMLLGFARAVEAGSVEVRAPLEEEGWVDVIKEAEGKLNGSSASKL